MTPRDYITDLMEDGVERTPYEIAEQVPAPYEYVRKTLENMLKGGYLKARYEPEMKDRRGRPMRYYRVRDFEAEMAARRPDAQELVRSAMGARLPLEMAWCRR